MLQQILRDLYVDPEILSELDEEQKQILFVKMRQEQVRRWKESQDEFEKESKNKPKSPKPGNRKVDFLKGADGCEWVWVMGEHKNDLSVEEILEQEAQKKALVQAEEEALALREKEELELKKKIEAEKLRIQQENDRLERELKEKTAQMRLNEKAGEETGEEVQKISQLKHQFEQQEQKRLKELSEEQNHLRRRSIDVKKRRSMEIYSNWKMHRQELEKEVEEKSKEVEESWKVQEEKSKEADKEMRDIARRARLEYSETLRRTSNLIQAARAFSGTPTSSDNKPPLPPKKHLLNNSATVGGKRTKPRPLRPRSRNMVIDWFIREERDKGSGLDPATGEVAQWFHGIISRADAERHLSDKDTGAFLVRVSERVWGYTISYKEKKRCKHFLIDTTDLGYQFFGANQVVHKSLAELVNFHKETPMTISGQEMLKEPCGQLADPPDYCELFRGNKTESTAL